MSATTSLASVRSLVARLRDSLELGTTLASVEDAQLAAVADRLAHRCTTLTLAARAERPDAQVVSSAAASVQQSCEDLTALWQIMRRDKAQQELVLQALRPLVVRALDATSQLLELLQKRKTATSVSPGTGLVWSVCEELKAFQPSLVTVVCGALRLFESQVEDTSREMSSLPRAGPGDDDDNDDDDDDDDDDEGSGPLTAAEAALADCALGAIKGARGTLRGCGALAPAAAEHGLAPLHRAGKAVVAAVEDVGCALYHPQDAAEVLALLRALRVAVEALAGHAVAALPPDQAPRALKMQAVALQLCDAAVSAAAAQADQN